MVATPRAYKSSFLRRNSGPALRHSVSPALRKNTRVVLKRRILGIVNEVYELLRRVRRVKLLMFMFKTLSPYRVLLTSFYTSSFYVTFQSWMNMKMSPYFGRLEGGHTLLALGGNIEDFVNFQRQRELLFQDEDVW